MSGLQIGPIAVGTPVVLAPMAGVTNAPFRRLCREAGAAGLPADRPDLAAGPAPAGLYVAEMVTSRALVEHTPESMRIISHDAGEAVRSVQLYGVDPATVRAAVRMLVTEDRADHIDLNFGCPVAKVTRKGGGAVLPWKSDLFGAIITAAAEETRGTDVPLTIKMRMGIDADHLTYLDAARHAQDAGVAAIALHARTAADYYSGTAHWDAIATLKQAITEVPVLGNGDIWSAEDAQAMVAYTGCDGVVVGRGCQGRPWLFTDLVAAFAGSDLRVRPGLAEVAEVIRRHALLMVEHFGEELKALRELRKHLSWYMKGYVVGGEARRQLGLVSTLAELDERLEALDLSQPYPGEAAEGPRGRAGSPKRPHVPEGWLDSRVMDESWRAQLAEAELSISGG